MPIPPQPAAPFVVRAGRAFDGERFLPGGAAVLVRDGRIAAVEPASLPWPDGVRVLELPGTTLVPGLIDSHVHLVGSGEPDALARDADRDDAGRAEVVRGALRDQLAHGVTAVRDLGDTRWAVLDRTPAGDEPTVVASGPPITSPGGHCAAMGGAVAGTPGGRGPALREAVRERHRRGATTVKVMVSGGAMTSGSDLLALQFTEAEVRAVVEEAHRLGLPVTAHAHPTRAVEVALAAGVAGIEHCTCLAPGGIESPPALAQALADRGVTVCPTLGRRPDLPPSPQALEVMRRTGMTLEARFRQVGALHAAGVRLTAGSDAGIHPAKAHGVLPYAVAELVRCGLPAAAALAAATATAADSCGLADTTGRLRAGLSADLLLVDGDLATEVAALTRPRLVVLRGLPRRPDDGDPPVPS